MITYIEQTFNGKMQVTLSGTMNKRVSFKPVQVIILHRLQSMKIFPQFFQACGNNISLNQRNPPF